MNGALITQRIQQVCQEEYEVKRDVLKQVWKKRWEDVKKYLKCLKPGEINRTIDPHIIGILKEIFLEVENKKIEISREEIYEEVKILFLVEVSESLVEILEGTAPESVINSMKFMKEVKNEYLPLSKLDEEMHKEVRRIGRMLVVNYFQESVAYCLSAMIKLFTDDEE